MWARHVRDCRAYCMIKHVIYWPQIDNDVRRRSYFSGAHVWVVAKHTQAIRDLLAWKLILHVAVIHLDHCPIVLLNKILLLASISLNQLGWYVAKQINIAVLYFQPQDKLKGATAPCLINVTCPCEQLSNSTTYVHGCSRYIDAKRLQMTLQLHFLHTSKM